MIGDTVSLLPALISAIICGISALLFRLTDSYGWDLIPFICLLASVVSAIVTILCLVGYFFGPLIEESNRQRTQELIALCLRAHQDWTRIQCEYDIQLRR